MLYVRSKILAVQVDRRKYVNKQGCILDHKEKPKIGKGRKAKYHYQLGAILLFKNQVYLLIWPSLFIVFKKLYKIFFFPDLCSLLWCKR